MYNPYPRQYQPTSPGTGPMPPQPTPKPITTGPMPPYVGPLTRPRTPQHRQPINYQQLMSALQGRWQHLR